MWTRGSSESRRNSSVGFPEEQHERPPPVPGVMQFWDEQLVRKATEALRLALVGTAAVAECDPWSSCDCHGRPSKSERRGVIRAAPEIPATLSPPSPPQLYVTLFAVSGRTRTSRCRRLIGEKGSAPLASSSWLWGSHYPRWGETFQCCSCFGVTGVPMSHPSLVLWKQGQ